MNNLSWMIYLADVLPSLSNAVFGMSMASLIVVVFVVLLVSLAQEKLFFPRVLGWIIAGALSLITLSTLVPSKDTLYLIAASQTGEQAMKTPEFTKIRSILDNWLNKEATVKKAS